MVLDLLYCNLECQTVSECCWPPQENTRRIEIQDLKVKSGFLGRVLPIYDNCQVHQVSKSYFFPCRVFSNWPSHLNLPWLEFCYRTNWVTQF